MKIKSLLLGSAAALTVASGAQAADAIMAAAPEPVEYVRVCDAFGTGYFYIPGTETCLKLSGYVRFDAGGGDLEGLDTDFDGDGDAWAINSRFTFRTDTKSDTELGVLHTYTEIRFNYTNSPATSVSYDPTTGTYTATAGAHSQTDVKFAYIELGGFRVGKTESEFSRLAFYGHGYAGGVIDDTLVPYGPFDALQISYTYKAPSGFAAVIALEDDNLSLGEAELDPATGIVDVTATGDDNYIPDVLVGVAYDSGTFGAAIIGAYDESAEEGAIKARVDATLGRVSAFLMGGWNTDGDTANHFANWGGDWAVWGGVSADLTERVSSNVQLSYDDSETFGAAGNLVFHVVPGFDVTTEVDYKDTAAADGDVGGIIRFQRSF